MPKQYLDAQGNPIAAPAKVYLDDNGNPTAAPAATAPDLTANPNNEGVYKMQGPSGTVGVPFSNVLHAEKAGYKLDAGDHDRFSKDYQGAPLPGPSLGQVALSTAGDTLKALPSTIWNAGKGLVGLAAPPGTTTEHAISLGGPAALPIYRMAKGVIGGEKLAAQQTAQYAHDTMDPKQSGVVPTLLNGARTGLSALSMVNPIDPAGAAGINADMDAGRPGDAVAQGLLQAGTLAAPMVAPRALEFVRGKLSGDLDAPIAGTGGMTPNTRFAALQRTGVQPDAAEATNSPLLTAIKNHNQATAAGSGAYESAKGANIASLSDTAKDLQDAASPVSPEVAGAGIQSALKAPFVGLQDQVHDTLGSMSPLQDEAGGARLQGLAKAKMDEIYDKAQQGYKDVAGDYGALPANNASLINKTAEDIGAKNDRFGQQFPSLESKRMMSVVGDAAQLGNESQRAYLGAPTVSDLIRSRSALLDLTRDPEIVKSSYGGDIQRLIAAHDQAIMDSLPQDGQEAWRAANAQWESMKNTFDNPTSGYYNAVRTTNPATLKLGIGGTSPAAVSQLKDITGDEGVGIAARANAEKLLGKTPEGYYDLRNLGAPLARIPEDSAQALFGPNLDTLRDVGEKYRDMQPYEKAAFDDDPVTLTKGIGARTGASFRDLAPRIGPEGVGAIQRGEISNLLGVDREGQPNFPTFGRKLAMQPADYHGALFGESPGGTQRLNDIATAANTLDTNLNRSGTATLARKIGDIGTSAAAIPSGITEAVLGHPIAGAATIAAPILYNGAEYGVSRLMNSPKFVDWLMKPKSLASSPRFIPPPASTLYPARQQ
jgi:hypothetical protein